MQFPSLFAANKFSRMPTPKILLKPSLPFNLNLWYPPPIFCVPNSSELLKFGSFLLIPPHTIMDMRNNNRRNVSTHARVNFSQSETSSILRGEGGELNFELLLGGGGGLTEKILKFLLKKLKHHCQKIQKWSFRIFSVHAIKYQEKSENYMAQKLK